MTTAIQDIDDPSVVKVVRRGRFSVSVYAEGGQRHHLPHCHVTWSDGETRVELPALRVLAGDDLPAAARELLQDSRDEIAAAWNELNPGRTIT